MPALGVPKEIARGEPLSRFQYYLGLPDALAWKEHAESAHLRELADSFSHDILNLAALAGRLLWHEGVTPDMWRSHDLIAVCLDTEAYFVMLQTACDIMAEVVATLGAKPNQAPSDSFHKLTEWARREPNRLAQEYRLVSDDLPWFREINAVRTKLVHGGSDIWVYTERVAFEWDVHVPGSKVKRGRYLLQSFQQLTRSMLDFSEALGEVVLRTEGRQQSARMKVIDGLYVPALCHLVGKYEVPAESGALSLSARCLIACGGYVEAAYVGYPDEYWWNLLVALSERIGAGPSIALVNVNPSGVVDDCKFVFAGGAASYGMIACEEIDTTQTWLDEARESLEQLASDYRLKTVVVAGRKLRGSSLSSMPGTRMPVIIEGDAARAADKIFSTLTRAG